MSVTLETERLLLRPFRNEDHAAYAASDHWGKGYAIEGARACMDYAFGPLDRERVISLIRPANERSICVAERLGERLAGEVELLGSTALVYEKRR
jgi:RimJ/RimL family protein N-acetyltransferase